MTIENDDRPVVDMAELLKDRVAAGQPIFLTGRPTGVVADATMAIAKQAAAETGMPAKVIQLVNLPEVLPDDSQRERLTQLCKEQGRSEEFYVINPDK